MWFGRRVTVTPALRHPERGKRGGTGTYGTDLRTRAVHVLPRPRVVHVAVPGLLWS